MQAVKERRTQKERRETTIRKLLDAATECLIELGFAGSTVQEISRRAGVSQGGLFRHFPTREALMVAVGHDVGQKLLAHYRREVTLLKGEEELFALVLRLVREHCRSRINQAWYELCLAARTNENLRKALKPVAQAYEADIADLARELLPDLAEAMGDQFGVLVSTMIAVFDGEAIHRFVLKDPKLDQQRIPLLLSMLSHPANGSSTPFSSSANGTHPSKPVEDRTKK